MLPCTSLTHTEGWVVLGCQALHHMADLSLSGRELEKALLRQAQAAMPAGARTARRAHAGPDPDPKPKPGTHCVPLLLLPPPGPPSPGSSSPAPRSGPAPVPLATSAARREEPDEARRWEEPDEARRWEERDYALPRASTPPRPSARRTTVLHGFARRRDDARGAGADAAEQEGLGSQQGYGHRAWQAHGPHDERNGGGYAHRETPGEHALGGWEMEAPPAGRREQHSEYAADSGREGVYGDASGGWEPEEQRAGWREQQGIQQGSHPTGGGTRAFQPDVPGDREAVNRPAGWRGQPGLLQGPYPAAGDRAGPLPSSEPASAPAHATLRPYADERSLEAFMERGQALEDALLRLNVERQGLAAEAARFHGQVLYPSVLPTVIPRHTGRAHMMDFWIYIWHCHPMSCEFS